MHHLLVSIVAGLFVLGVLVLVHEFGHFAVAKLCKVRVEVFSLGFGKRLLGFRRGDTDYRISAIPLGGYVKMAGETPMESHTGSPDEFSSHPRWQRFLIAIAGPAMNILLAIAVLTGLYMAHFPRPMYLESAPVVGYVVKDSPAEKAGIQTGDRILQVDHYNTNTWDDLLNQLQIYSGQPIRFTVERAGKSIEVKLPAVAADDESDPREVLGISQDEPLEVTEVESNMPAASAGLRVGDKILRIDNTTPHSMLAIMEYLQAVKTKPIEITVLRGGQERALNLAAVLDEKDQRYRIGFRSEWVRDDKLPFSEALNASLRKNKQTSMLIVEFLQRLVERKMSIKKVNSFVTIVDASGTAAEMGTGPLLSLMAMISVNLGIFNLLPIPILDGGVILLLLVEGLMRRDLNRELKERIYQAAFVFLLLFAALVIFNDIAKYAHKL